jgi:hypothetical protein
MEPDKASRAQDPPRMYMAILARHDLSRTGHVGDKRQIGGQERSSFRGVKAPKKGPPQRTDIAGLEMVPDGKGQKGC